MLLNLLSNARHALNRKHTGPHPEKSIRIGASALSGTGAPLVRVTVFDRGTGIPPGEVDKVFDPFFSTKPSGEGTGLGLSISYGIVKEHGGELTVESELGTFTRIHLDLPALGEA